MSNDHLCNMEEYVQSISRRLMGWCENWKKWGK